MIKNQKWTIEKIRIGLEKFYQLYNRYPTALEIDDFNLLPSSKQIQRRFGGLINLRKQLGLSIENYSNGKERSIIASRVNKDGKEYEIMVFRILNQIFDEKFIHIERPVTTDNKYRYDFYIYAKPKNFSDDVFNTTIDIRGFIRIMNIKEKKYKRLIKSEDENLYFVYFGKNITKERIQKWLYRKKNKIPFNWKIMNIDEFKKEILKYNPYKIL